MQSLMTTYRKSCELFKELITGPLKFKMADSVFWP